LQVACANLSRPPAGHTGPLKQALNVLFVPSVGAAITYLLPAAVESVPAGAVQAWYELDVKQTRSEGPLVSASELAGCRCISGFSFSFGYNSVQ
jgi:hypothetical protein